MRWSINFIFIVEQECSTKFYGVRGILHRLRAFRRRFTARSMRDIRVRF